MTVSIHVSESGLLGSLVFTFKVSFYEKHLICFNICKSFTFILWQFLRWKTPGCVRSYSTQLWDVFIYVTHSHTHWVNPTILQIDSIEELLVSIKVRALSWLENVSVGWGSCRPHLTVSQMMFINTSRTQVSHRMFEIVQNPWKLCWQVN